VDSEDASEAIVRYVGDISYGPHLSLITHGILRRQVPPRISLGGPGGGRVNLDLTSNSYG